MPHLRTLHFWIGILALITFLSTGAYMRHLGFNHPESMDKAGHLMFRSCHIYILFTAVANLLLGLYYSPGLFPVSRVLQTIGSSLILATPFFAITAFCVEPYLSTLIRPWSQPTLYSLFAGTILHFLSSIKKQA